ncbi:MAG: glycosyltransferase family 4 protein, partial [Candidatus Sumerlaeia bacterium]|nr:glycosyltransferase family 4 protein [Candidatus Sumerlaeia bacterium]
ALERTDGIITLSDYVRNTMLNHYGQKYAPKFRRIPSGVDVNVFRPPEDASEKQAIRKQLGLPVDRILFLTVRRMALRMGWFNLEEAIKLLFDRHPELKTEIMFIFVGGGEIFDKVRETAYNLGILPYIIFTGPRYEEIPLYYRAADCFVLPTAELEGFGIVSIEAFASGIPVIGTPRSAVPEVLREVDPELITPNHLPDGLYQGIWKMVKKIKAGEINPAYFRQIAVSKFSWEVIVQNIEDFMRELIATKSSR